MADSLTPNFSFIIQQPGTNRNVWGGKLNANWTSIDGILFTAVTNASNAITAANAALPRAGGTMTGNIVLPQAASLSSSEAGFKGAPGAPISGGAKTLTNTDNGVDQILASGAATLTISAGLPLGMVVPITNEGAGALTIVRASGVSLRLAGSSVDQNVTLAGYGQGVLKQSSANRWTFAGVGAS